MSLENRTDIRKLFSQRPIFTQSSLVEKSFEANKKINSNLMQANEAAEALPVDSTDPRIQNMSALKYLWTTHLINNRNSKLIEFNYPEIATDFGFNYNPNKDLCKPSEAFFQTKP